jgi:hypothetical protein
VTAPNANVNLSLGTITVTGTPSAPTHNLLTALSITGTPTLSTPIAGYLLQVSGNQLQLVQAPISPYDTWKTQITNGLDLPTDDPDGDSLTNLKEFLFGTSPTSTTGGVASITTTSDATILRWKQRSTGASYTIQQSTTLDSNSWTTVTSPIPTLDSDQTHVQSGYQSYTIRIPSTGQRQFFKILSREN